MKPNQPDVSSTLASINRRLGVLVVLAIRAQMGDAPKKDLVQQMASFGLETREISDLLGIPVTTVAPILSRSRPKTKERK